MPDVFWVFMLYVYTSQPGTGLLAGWFRFRGFDTTCRAWLSPPCSVFGDPVYEKAVKSSPRDCGAVGRSNPLKGGMSTLLPFPVLVSSCPLVTGLRSTGEPASSTPTSQVCPVVRHRRRESPTYKNLPERHKHTGGRNSKDRRKM